MCGITGILSRNTDDDGDLKIALERLIHRGPDDCGVWRNEGISLGHRRLSILDLSTLGHQPMSYADSRFWITYNGEIYNYLELREELIAAGYSFISRSDTEVLLAAYYHWGIDCLDKFRGMFAFALWDSQKEQLFLARDRCGEKPLYYWYNENRFVFASEMKALISLLPVRPELDPASIDMFLHYEYVPEPRTLLKGVDKLAAGYYILLDRKEWRISPACYWNLERIPPLDGDPAELIRHELEKSIQLTLRSDVPIGIALSGGIDSGAVAVLAARRYEDTMHAFSIGYPGRPAYDERHNAKRLATELNMPFSDIELSTDTMVSFFPEMVMIMDDPIADMAAFGHYSVMKLAAKHGLKVMLSGLGGDELFWGYPWVNRSVVLTEKKRRLLRHAALYTLLKQIETKPLTANSFYQRLVYSSRLPISIKKIIKGIDNFTQLCLKQPNRMVISSRKHNAFMIIDEMLRRIYTRAFIDRLACDASYRLFEEDINEIDIPIRICQFLFDTWFVSNCLALGDRVSMASSVEVRLPLLDFKLIETTFGLRKLQRDHILGSKAWFKSALKGILSDEVLNRPKRGFQPPKSEWQQALIEAYFNQLKNGFLIDSEIIKPINITQGIDKRNKSEFLDILYKLILLEYWCRVIYKV
jgi:asparagine synthase (glutamine-hydrolysing)